MWWISFQWGFGLSKGGKVSVEVKEAHARWMKRGAEVATSYQWHLRDDWNIYRSKIKDTRAVFTNRPQSRSTGIYDLRLVWASFSSFNFCLISAFVHFFCPHTRATGSGRWAGLLCNSAILRCFYGTLTCLHWQEPLSPRLPRWISEWELDSVGGSKTNLNSFVDFWGVDSFHLKPMQKLNSDQSFGGRNCCLVARRFQM